jgi:hypothetical protein
MPQQLFHDDEIVAIAKRPKFNKRKRMGIEPTRPARLASPVLKTGTDTSTANAPGNFVTADLWSI